MLWLSLLFFFFYLGLKLALDLVKVTWREVTALVALEEFIR